MPLSPSTMTLHGHELSYLDKGDGPVVLFVHGILGSQHNWARLIDLIDDTQRVVVPDLLGHGQSDKPMGDYSLSSHAATLRDLLDRLGIETVTLVGHSLGGGIAMQFFYLFPERVERLVLVSSGGLGREVSLSLRAATLPGAEQVLGVVASDWTTSRLEKLAGLAGKVGWKPAVDVNATWRGFRSLGDRESRRAFLATARAVIDLGGQTVSAHRHLLDVQPPPTLVVWGSKDRVIPVDHALNAQESVPQARVEIFDGAGHFPHLDDPTRFAALLREFVTAT
ncbi:alpha/beta fold hydrolase [Nocardioides yefusunii]|uniref:Alpha/beta fold hydrolase n=1 Tax=Nocardioides yefusunii TaxID=2500546 RepID=A0ABW1QVL7_9ACTN|nr:alpha/beta fold hydrolase [Nocardioides yefusunii]